MTKRITKNELPEKLTDETLSILVDMALEFPQSTEWHEVFDELDKRGELIFVLNRVLERQKQLENKIENAEYDENNREERLKNLDRTKFYGNMAEPETPQQYKDKYGVWPPGYE